MQLIQAIKWSFLSEIASKAVQPLVFIVLARLLTPEDYGVVAAATMVISFSQIFWEAGMAKAIIQYQGERSAAANSAFWINNLLGIFVAGILIVSADVIADKIFHDPRVASVLQVMSLQVLLSASVSIHTALLQKDMQFKTLFWVRLSTITIPGLISIPMAWQGMGYWALVTGTLIGQAFQIAILWWISHWKPRFSFDSKTVKQLISFGGWVTATGLFSWFYAWADSMIVGLYLGSHELGLYRTGNTFVIMVYSLLFGPVMPVIYSYFSKNQDNHDHIKNTLSIIIKLISLISIPIAFIMFGSAYYIEEIIFSKKWLGISQVIAVLAMMHGYSWIVGANGEVYRAIGKPEYETKIIGYTFFLYLIGYITSIQFSFETFLWTRLGLAIIALNIHLWVAKKSVTIKTLACYIYIFKITLICLPVTAGFIEFKNHLHGINIFFIFLFFILFTATLLLASERKTLISIINSIDAYRKNNI